MRDLKYGVIQPRMVLITLEAGQYRFPVRRTVSCAAMSAASISCKSAGCCGKTGEGRTSDVPGLCSSLAGVGDSDGVCKRLCRGTSRRNFCAAKVGKV